jgi:Histidine kinase-like ATPase domain
LSLDHLGLEDSVVWEAVGLLAPVVSAETERRLKFRGMPQAIGAARRVLRAWESHFEPDLFYDLSLCISELVTNRVRHSSASAEEIELLVRRDQELVRVEVSQLRSAEITGRPFVEERSEWELFIVDRVADRWGLDGGQHLVMWCEIDLAGDGWSRS